MAEAGGEGSNPGNLPGKLSGNLLLGTKDGSLLVEAGSL